MRGEELKNVISVDDLDYNKLNLIEAPCGAGKTSFAIEVLANKFGPDRTLLLIDTVMGRDQLAYRDECSSLYETYLMSRVMPEEAFDEWIVTQVVVMTYAQFAYRYREDKNILRRFKCIVCDEIHNLSNFIKWDNAKKKFDRITSDNHLAMDLIIGLAKQDKRMVVAMTATPKKFIESFKEKALIKRIIPSGEVRHYETFNRIEYNNLGLLLKDIDANKTGLIYVNHIKDIIKYKKLLLKRGIAAEGVWSINNEKYEMSKDQIGLRDMIKKERRIPDGIQVLLINKSCETSINIENQLDYVVVHSREEDVQVQARGRVRNDLDRLYVYNSNHDDYIWNIDDKWVEVRLTTDKKKEFVAEMNIIVNGAKAKWPKLKDMIDSSPFYWVEDTHSGSIRYSIIHEEEL